MPDIYEEQRQCAVEFVRKTWEGRRAEIRDYLLRERGFNPKSVDRFISQFIDSIVFAAEETSKWEAALARALAALNPSPSAARE